MVAEFRKPIYKLYFSCILKLRLIVYINNKFTACLNKYFPTILLEYSKYIHHLTTSAVDCLGWARSPGKIPPSNSSRVA